MKSNFIHPQKAMFTRFLKIMLQKKIYTSYKITFIMKIDDKIDDKNININKNRHYI